MNPEGTTPEALLRDAHVLVVDDSRLMRLGLIRALAELGVRQANEAGNGREALEKIRTSSFDLVLLDIEMPEMTGIELLREMKREGLLARLPVIVISSAEQLETAVQCIEAGAEDYLPKSFNPTLLRARVMSSLEKKRLRDLDALRARQLQAEKELLEATQQRLDKELDDAANYVRSIFPAPSDSPLRIDWHYQPSTELGGDAFGYHWIDDDHFAVYLLDVCGHGVGACLLSVSAINVIRSGALAGTDWRDPAAVMKALGNAFLMERQNNMYFTLWYGVYHRQTRRLRHASGGHPPALLLQPGTDGSLSCERLRAPGMIVGMMEDIDYDAHECEVPTGSVLYVLCDGCFEIRDTAGKDISFEDFEATVLRHGRDADGPARIFDWAHQLHGRDALEDDFSLVRIQF